MSNRTNKNRLSTFIVTIAFATLAWLILEAKRDAMHGADANSKAVVGDIFNDVRTKSAFEVFSRRHPGSSIKVHGVGDGSRPNW